MVDDSPNAARIKSMLDDLAKQRQGSRGGQSPVSVPQNLPMAPSPMAPQSPRIPVTPRPVAPPARPTTPPPAPSVQAQPPSRTAPIATPPLRKPPVPSPQMDPQAPQMPTQSQPIPAPKPQKPSIDAGKSSPPNISQVTSEIRTMSADVQRLKTGQAPTSIPVPATVSPGPTGLPGVPPPPRPSTAGPTPPASTPSGIDIPDSPSRALNRKVLFGVLGIIIFFGVIYAVVSMLSGRDTVPTPTPAVTQTETPRPTLTTSVRTLSSIFGQPFGTLELSLLGPDAPVQPLRNRLGDLVPTGGSARHVTVDGVTSRNVHTLLDQIGSYWHGDSGVERFATSGLGEDYAVLIFGQEELFDTDGRLKARSFPEARLVFIFELTDVSEANQGMMQWEDFSPTMSDELSQPFDLNTSQAFVKSFYDGIYRQVPIRYRNFPYADKSIDWSIVTASNAKSYLVIAASRESIFFTIDQLLK